ncbi:flagellar basal body-associated FliL family protein [Guyparkeria halophila]|uniref:Flagellar protein FliL n=1 Tax=Guyparkeria halophila TaxID=47960 RepID=A0ABZ0YXQ9_9GAMM|nr:flagellar basal body-associated FliL family protein [Guyparkeria halophila]WQH16950.1 flagellar basal body-associated FliL family protein [Guyparkeria halophila]
MAEGDEAATEKKGGNKLIVILLAVLIVVILAIGGVVTTLLLTGDDDKAAGKGEETAEQSEEVEEPKGPPITVSLGDPITVNLSKPNDANVLQVQLDLVTRAPKVEELIKTQRSRIVNDVMLVLSDVDSAELRTRAGKEALQETLSEEINRILEDGSELEQPVENVYFTKLLMQ